MTDSTVTPPIRILYIDDSAFDRELVSDALREEAGVFELVTVTTRAEFEVMLAQEAFTLILSDFNILGFEGLQVIDAVHAKDPALPVIIVTGTGSETIAVEAMKRGAADYIIKTTSHIRRLPHVIHTVLDRVQFERERVQTRVNTARSAHQLQSILACTGEGIFGLDVDGRHTFANPAAVALLGYTDAEDLIGLHSHATWHYAHPNGTAYPPKVCPIYATLRDGQVRSGEDFFWRKDGSGFPVKFHCRPMLEADEQVVGAVVSFDDITEQREAAAALAQEKNLLRTLIDLLPDAIYVKDVESRYVINNEAAAHVLGAASPEETIGKRDFDYFPPDMADGFYTDERAVIEHGERVIRREERVRSGQGENLWFSTTKVPLYNAQEEIVGLVGIGHDITDRKAAAARIESQLHQLAALHAIDQAITGVMTLDQTLDVVLEQIMAQLMVDAATILFLDPEEHLLTFAAGRGLRTPLVKDEMISSNVEHIRILSEERRPLQISDPAENVSGPFLQFWEAEGLVNYVGIPLVARERVIGVLEVFQRTHQPMDDDWIDFLTTVAGQVAVAVDNAALFVETQAQAQLTQQIIDSTPEGMVMLDSAHRLVLANPTALTYLPVLATLSPGDVVTDLNGYGLADLLRSTARDGTRIELTFTHPDRILEVAVQPLTTGQYTGGSLLVIWDVTNERSEQRYFEAQERLATVGQLAAGVAHDFNNIMGVIVLYAQMLARASNLTPKQQTQLTTIQEQANHATNLIRQILDFSRRSVMEKLTLDLLPLLKEAVKLLERTLPETIDPSLSYETRSYMVFGDPTRLQQVFMNLTLNARDAKPDGGKLDFALSYLTLQPGETPPVPDMTPGRWVSLAVSDTGTGIDPNAIAHLFEPFFTTKAPGKGTGLGLAQVYGIVKQHEGHIAVHSQVGKGATFTLYLPAVVDASTAAEDAPVGAVTVGAGERILLVEDSEKLRQSIAEILTDLGYSVVCAEDGVAALALCQPNGPGFDLVITDLVMPRMGGAALVQALRQQQIASTILVMTGHPLGENESLIQDFDVDWILKPFDIDILSTRIHTLLGDRDRGGG